jgi:Uma2 family endonuclease
MALQLQHRKFTVDDYHQMAEAGILGEDDRVELIRGEILDMSPIGKRHAACINRLNALLAALPQDLIIVSIQNPIQLYEDTEVQPDVALLRFRDDFYEQELPRPSDMLLIVEVSDTTLAYDRRIKLPLYAQAGIPEVWLVNIQQGVIELHAQPKDGVYSRIRRVRHGQKLAVPGFDKAYLNVDDVLGLPVGE